MFDWSDEKDQILRKEIGIGFQDIVFHLDRGDLVSIAEHPNTEKYPNQMINIRISSRDLGSLQRRANQYGMPYQTLISSILHRYISGDLTESTVEEGVSSDAKQDRRF